MHPTHPPYGLALRCDAIRLRHPRVRADDADKGVGVTYLFLKQESKPVSECTFGKCTLPPQIKTYQNDENIDARGLKDERDVV